MLRRIKQFLFQNKQFQNFSIYGFGQFFNLVTPLLVAPYIIKICGEEGFGKAGIGLSLAFILTVLVDFASGINGVKDISVNRENTYEVNKIVRTLFGIKLLSLGFIILFTLFLIFYIPFLAREKELFLLSLVILVSQAANPTWLLQGIEKFKLISLINIISKLLYIALIFLFIKSEDDYIYVNLYFGASSLIVFLGCIYLLIKQRIISFGLPNKKDIKDIFRRDYKLTFSQLLLSLQQYSPIILVGYLGGDFLAGIYKIIEQIIMMIRTYLQVIFNFFYPRVCYLIAKDHRHGIVRWFQFNSLNFVVVTVVLTGCFVFSKEILLYFNITEIENTSTLLRFALSIPLLFSVSLPLQQLLLAFNYQKQYVNITIVSSIFLIIILVLSFPYFELHGVFSTLLMTEALVILLYICSLRGNLFNVS